MQSATDVRRKAITTKVQLEAAFDYLKECRGDLTNFDKAAGVGVVVTDADIQREVSS